jgi:non-specific serine/threonine protein kinase
LEDLEAIMEFIPMRNRNIDLKDWPAFLEKKILPFSRKYHVAFDKSMISEPIDGKPETRLMLQEKNDYLVFVPQFLYQDHEIKHTDKDEGGGIHAAIVFTALEFHSYRKQFQPGTQGQ